MESTSHPHEHPSHLPKKRTIIKDRVGCVRTSTYHLPGENHVFGAPTQMADEGAAEVISNWVTANPSLEKKSSRMVVYSNVLAVKKGCITAKSMRQYAIDHPNIRMLEALPSDSTRVDNRHEGPFGIKTQFANESMQDLLQAKYTDYTNEDTDYPSVTSIKKTGFMPVPRPTLASTAIIGAREKQREKEQEEKKRFIMKRFQNIKGTFQRERELEEEMKKELANSQRYEE